MKGNRKFTHLGPALETGIKINVNAAVTKFNLVTATPSKKAIPRVKSQAEMHISMSALEKKSMRLNNLV